MARIVTLSAYRFEGASRLWALWQMGAARPSLMRRRGLAFWKLCGSGRGAGFRPSPDPGVAAILAAWDSPEAAAEGLARRPWSAWGARAREGCTLLLAPTAQRGAWSGRAPFGPGAAAPAPGPVASITRASIRPRAAARFWAHVPALDALFGANGEALFGLGIGELPWIRQGTFTVWPSEAAMARYARTGAHAEAIAAVRRGDLFGEALYARFAVLGADGTWRGRPPVPGARPLAEALGTSAAGASGPRPAPGGPGHRAAAAR